MKTTAPFDQNPESAGFYQRLILSSTSIAQPSAALKSRAADDLIASMRALHAPSNHEELPEKYRQQKLLDLKIDTVRSLVSADPMDWLDNQALEILRVIVLERTRPGLPMDCGTPLEIPTIFESNVWTTPLMEAVASTHLPAVGRAVGRIEVGGVVIGTGILISSDRVITNQHVLDEYDRRRPAQWTIDFSDAPDSASNGKFELKGELVQSSGVRDRQRSYVIDVAAIAVDQFSMDGSSSLPVPAAISLNPVLPDDRGFIGAIGYPDRPDISRLTSVAYNAAVGAFTKFRVKTISPGQIIAGRNESGDDSLLSFLHDTSTLPGSSGSVVVRLGEAVEVIGLHRSGSWFKHNRAHCLASVRQAAPGLFD